MTDEQIIKALECCITGKSYADCESMGCPLYLGITLGCKYVDNENKLYADALDLIIRQKAEIERLKEDIFIQSQKRANIFEIVDAYERGKSEAVKEFAERLREKYSIADVIVTVDATDIDNLVKEMVGDKE